MSASPSGAAKSAGGAAGIRVRAAADAVAGARTRYVVVACLAIAALSLLLPSVPSYDPWAWIIWGRETLGLDLNTRGDVAWKPLPVLFTTVFGLFGAAAPDLWLVLARAGGLLALVLAYRLATRLANPAAGAIAALALALARDWTRYLANGLSEPLLVALILWAIQTHLDGRRDRALLLALGAALIRPEVWPFLGLYALFLWTREPALRRLVAGVLLAVPLLWIAPEWVGSGDPLEGSDRVLAVAGASDVQTARSPVLYALVTGLDRAPPPVYVGAAVAVILALRRSSATVLALAAGALGWMFLVLAMTLAGYPGLGRFFDASSALLCVLAGVGTVWAIQALGPGRRALIAALAVTAVSLPFLVLRADRVAEDGGNAVERAHLQGELESAVDRAGDDVISCQSPVFPTAPECRIVANKSFLTALAWQLDLHIVDVSNRSARPALVFSTPPGFVAGSAPALEGGAMLGTRSRRRLERVARAGDWTVYSDR